MIKKKDVEEFERLALGLDNLVKRIKKYNAEVNLYVDGSAGLYLMDGPTHDEYGEAVQENAVASERIQSIGGGDW